MMSHHFAEYGKPVDAIY